MSANETPGVAAKRGKAAQSSTDALWRRAAAIFMWALAGRLFLLPLTWIVPRRRDLVVVRGRDGGKFIDNCKYFFAAANARPQLGITPVYLVTDVELRDLLRINGAKAEISTSIRGLALWIRAGTIVVDSVDWMQGMRFGGARNARVVQLWHGIPLKHIQLGRIKQRRPRQPKWKSYSFAFYLWMSGRLRNLDWLVSTSKFVTDKAFSRSFRYNHVAHSGYPRNDALFSSDGKLADIGVDSRARSRIEQHRDTPHSGRIGLYAPTFRESLDDPFATGQVDLSLLSLAATRLHLLMLVKLHPWMHGRVRSGELPGIVFIAPDSDVYPLLREVDFLVTDYSSIFFDFLLLDRPVLFFSYDLDSYLSGERQMYFEYAQMTPGPKVESTAALIDEFERIAAGEDDWKSERARVRDLVFDHQDGHAADRLLDELFPGTAGH